MGTENQLKRVLGFWPVYAACFGIAISGSTLMLVGNLYGMAGMPCIVSQAIAAGLMLLVILAFSELSTMMPVAGGIGAYTKEALGIAPSAMVTLLYFVATTSLAVNALVDGSILNEFVPSISSLTWAIILVTFFLILNLFGNKIIAFGLTFGIIIIIGSYVLMAILAFCGVGRIEMDYSKLGDWTGLQPSNVIAFSMIAIWFFVGMEMATPLAEEVKKPEKTLPKAMIAGLLTVFTIQLLLGPAMYAGLNTGELTGMAPHFVFATKLFGNFGRYWVLIIQLALEFTTIGGVMFGISRLIYGESRDKIFPNILSWLHPKYKTPWASLFLIYIAVIIAIFVGAPFVLLSISSMLFFFIYLVVFIDLLILRNKKPDTIRPFFAGGPFKFPVVAILGIIAIIFVLIGNAIEDPAIISVGLPVVGICYLIPLLFYRLKRRKEHLE